MDVRCSVIVVGFNNARDLPACFEGVLGQDVADVELILVDNASNDETAAVVACFQDQVRYLRLTENRGFAAGNNAGVAIASGEMLVFLNPDTVTQPGCLSALIRPLVEDAALQGPDHLRAKCKGWIWLWRHRQLVQEKRRQTQVLRRTSDSRLLSLLSPRLRFTGAVPVRWARLLEGILTPLLAGYGLLCRRLLISP